MKKYRSTVKILLAVIIIAGMFLSCSMIEQDGKGTLVISLPGSDVGRAAVDPISNDLKNTLKYDILFEGPDGNSSEIVSAGSSISKNVSAGNWEITVTVLDAQGIKIGEEKETALVKSGKKTPVAFSIPIDIPVYLRASFWDGPPAGSNWSSRQHINIKDYYDPSLVSGTRYMVKISGYASKAMDNIAFGFKTKDRDFITEEYIQMENVINKGDFSISFNLTPSFEDNINEDVYLDIIRKTSVPNSISPDTVMASITNFDMVIRREVAFVGEEQPGLTISNLAYSLSNTDHPGYKVEIYPNIPINTPDELEKLKDKIVVISLSQNVSIDAGYKENEFFLIPYINDGEEKLFIWEESGLFTVVLYGKNKRTLSNVNFIDGKASVDYNKFYQIN